MSIVYTEYVALGDSMSIDLYPALDAGKVDVAVALERIEGAGTVSPIGAASLFYRNDDEAYPDESGNDLSSMFPGIAFRRLATDGATIGDVFGEQIALLGESYDPSIITLTIGSEDLFSAFSRTPKQAVLERIAADLVDAYDVLVGAIRAARPSSLVILTTVTDPSDRTGKVKGILDDAPLALTAMDAFNSHIRKLTSDSAVLRLADANGAFLGHGATQPEEHRWYWRRSPLEPNAVGAHELRKLWLEALREAIYE